MPYNFVVSIHTKNFVADFLKSSALFDGRWPFCIFESPFEFLEATYAVHLRLIGKHIVDILPVIDK